MIGALQTESDVSTWIVGDVHGHFGMLERLLEAIQFGPADHIIFVGDLVSGGGRSVDVVRWCAEHDAIVTLGNHDLHMLAVWSGARERRAKDDFDDVLDAPDAPALIEWLGGCPMTYHLPDFNTLVVHAGVAPQWTVEDAVRAGAEVETALHEADPIRFFADMYGNKPRLWKDDLSADKRLRFSINALTRMRVVDDLGRLEFEFSGVHRRIPPEYHAWFDSPLRQSSDTTIVFGHWSALGAQAWPANVVSLDAGVRWGRKLAAYCLDDGSIVKVSSKPKKPKRTKVV